MTSRSSCGLKRPISDNDNGTKKNIDSQISKIFNIDEFKSLSDIFYIDFLHEGNDFEAELINKLKISDELKAALIKSKTIFDDNITSKQSKSNKINEMDDCTLLKELRNNKTSYASFLSEIILENKNNKTIEELIPNSVINVFKKIEEWNQSC